MKFDWLIPVEYYTDMDLWWKQYGVLSMWGNNIDWGKADVNNVTEHPYNPYYPTS